MGERPKRRVVERRVRNTHTCSKKMYARPIVALWNKRRGSAKLNGRPWRESIVNEKEHREKERWECEATQLDLITRLRGKVDRAA